VLVSSLLPFLSRRGPANLLERLLLTTLSGSRPRSFLGLLGLSFSLVNATSGMTFLSLGTIIRLLIGIDYIDLARSLYYRHVTKAIGTLTSVGSVYQVEGI